MSASDLLGEMLVVRLPSDDMKATWRALQPSDQEDIIQVLSEAAEALILTQIQEEAFRLENVTVLDVSLERAFYYTTEAGAKRDMLALRVCRGTSRDEYGRVTTLINALFYTLLRLGTPKLSGDVARR